jgi:hypothetical protein
MKIVRRLLLFGLLGPALGFVMAFWVILQIFNVATGGESTAHPGQLILLPMAYALGIVPALATGLIDHYFHKKKLGVLYTCFAGYLLGFMPIATTVLMGFLHGPFVLLFGLIGAVPALVCSLIARNINPRERTNACT